MSSCDVLFLSPHPDDVEIFCGATAAALAASGSRVRIADLTRGELASNGTPELRREESLAAVQALGLDPERPVLDLPDGGIDARDEAQVARVVDLLRRQRPRLLFAPWPTDRHPDHEAAGRLARRASFLAGVRRFREDLGSGPHRPARVLYYPCHAEIEVDVVVDVSATMDAWRAGVACYGSQFSRGEGDTATAINRPDFVASQQARRAGWGARIGREWGEGFVHEGPWPIVDASRLIVDPDPGSRP